MKPGRELDALIAEKVMGLDPPMAQPSGRRIKGFWSEWDGLPHYSTSIEAAWEVVEKIKDLREHETFHIEWTGCNWEAGYMQYESYEPPSHDVVVGETPAHAICLAALKAVNSKTE